MKKTKTQNIILAVIAINLSIITIIQLDIFPNKAFAEKENFMEGNYRFVPLNEDGSIDVNINSEQIENIVSTLQNNISVNLSTIGGYDVAFSLGGRWNDKAVLWSFTEESKLD